VLFAAHRLHNRFDKLAVLREIDMKVLIPLVTLLNTGCLFLYCLWEISKLVELVPAHFLPIVLVVFCAKELIGLMIAGTSS